MPDSEYRPSDAEIASAAKAHNEKVNADYAELMRTWESFDQQSQPETQQASRDENAESTDSSATAADAVEAASLTGMDAPPEAMPSIQPNGEADESTIAPVVEDPTASTNGAEITPPADTGNASAQVDQAPTPDQPAPKKLGLIQRIFGVKPKGESPSSADAAVVPTATENPSVTEPTMTPVEAPATPEKAPIDGQAILTKLQEQLGSGSYDQLIADEDLKKAIITTNAPSILSADSLPNLRASLSADINRRLTETGKFKARQDQLYLSGKVNQLMDAVLGAESNDGSIVLSDGRTVDSESDEYKTLSRQIANELRDQQREVSRREPKSPARRMEAAAATKGEITAADLAPQSDVVPETTAAQNTPSAQENVEPATVAETATVDAATDTAAAAAAEQVTTSDSTPTAETGNTITTPEDSVAAPDEEAAPTKEADMARMAVLTESLNNATKDEIKGLSPRQVQELAEASKLVDKYSDENVEEDEATITAVTALSEALENAFTHQENYLSVEADDNWDTKRRLFIELHQAYNSELDLSDASVAAELEANIIEKLGEKPRAAQEKTLRRDWRRRKLGVKTEQRQGTIESKRQRGPEMTEAAVRKTIEVVGKGVGEVMAVPDHARNVYDTAATGVMSQVDRTLALIDRAGNVLGTVTDESLQFVLGMPEAVKIATLGIQVGVNEVADDLNVKIGEQIGKGVDAVKQAIERRIAQMKETAERGLQQRREAREAIKQNIVQTEQAMEARTNNGAALWGLLGAMKRLRTR